MLVSPGFGFPFRTPLKFLTVENLDTPEASGLAVQPASETLNSPFFLFLIKIINWS